MRLLLPSMLLALLLAAGVIAQTRCPVYCGSVTAFYFRVPAEGKDAETRANEAMDVINKYLGGSIGKVTTRASRKHVRLLLNNELVAIITPDDVRAEKQKSLRALAAKWTEALSTAFDASKARP